MHKIGIIDRGSGIYKITCIINGKIYIGSAQRFIERFYQHRNLLRRGKHGNIHLQRTYDKYGTNQFTYEVVERCEIADLLVREKYYIDKLNVCDDTIGYNMCPTPYGKRGYKMSEEQKIKIAKSVSKTKQKEGYTQGVRTDSQNLEMLKSWSDRMKVTFDIISPDGVLYTVTGISAFCRQHGLTPQNVTAMRKGRQKSVQGWRLPQLVIPILSTNV